MFILLFFSLFVLSGHELQCWIKPIILSSLDGWYRNSRQAGNFFKSIQPVLFPKPCISMYFWSWIWLGLDRMCHGWCAGYLRVRKLRFWRLSARPDCYFRCGSSRERFNTFSILIHWELCSEGWAMGNWCLVHFFPSLSFVQVVFTRLIQVLVLTRDSRRHQYPSSSL